MSNEEDEEQLPGEDELYDLWLEAGKSARVIADQIGLTDEDLAKIEKKWSTMGANGSAGPVSLLAHQVPILRLIGGLAIFIRPGETSVSLQELVARSHQKASS